MYSWRSGGIPFPEPERVHPLTPLKRGNLSYRKQVKLPAALRKGIPPLRSEWKKGRRRGGVPIAPFRTPDPLSGEATPATA
jgi:hypothetical protein